MIEILRDLMHVCISAFPGTESIVGYSLTAANYRGETTLCIYIYYTTTIPRVLVYEVMQDLYLRP